MFKRRDVPVLGEFFGLLNQSRTVLNCTVDIQVQGTADVKVLNLMHLLPDTTVEIDVSAGALNSAKQASFDVDMPWPFSMSLSMFRLNGAAFVWPSVFATLPLMTEEVESPTYTRWLPEQTVSFTSHHTRLNPLDATEDAPDIEEVAFYLSQPQALMTPWFMWNLTEFKKRLGSVSSLERGLLNLTPYRPASHAVSTRVPLRGC